LAFLAIALTTLLARAAAGRASPLEWVEPHTGMRFVLVRAGTFEMGIPGYTVFFPAENPVRRPAAEFLAQTLPVCEARPY